LPAALREAIIHRALQRINPEMHAGDILFMIRRARLDLEDQEEVRAAQGVNVHEGNRDARTKHAMQLLRDFQGVVSCEIIKLAKNEFVKYLKDFSDPVTKQLATHALLTPRGGENFGPLLDEDTFSVYGLEITGEEVIGRLWIFASWLGETEQRNAHIGMISALKTSYENGARVCNQGKTQRLFIAVLQGVLEGVDIDGVSIPKPISKADAMEMFFTPARQKIVSEKELTDAAIQFCADNSHINKEEFLKEIKAYIQVNPDEWTA
jgi:hypothetical protein